MILSFRHTALAALAALAATLGGCSESADGPESGPQEVLLRITVDPGLSMVSRAAEIPNGGYEGAAGDFEKIQTLRIIIVDGITDSDPNGTVEANRLVNTTAEGYPVNDNMVFRVKTGRKRIFLIANEGSLPSPDAAFTSSRLYLDSFREGYDYNSGTFGNWMVSLPGTNPSATASLYSNVQGAPGLPLTEYFDVTLETVPPSMHQGERIENIETQSVHLFMTRAAAKVTYKVFVDPSYKSGTNLTAIRLGGLNWYQWVFPHSAKYLPAKNPQVVFGASEAIPAVTNRFITEFSTPPRVNAVYGASVTTTLPAPVVLTSGTQDANTPIYTSAPVYFPESQFPSEAAPTDMFTVNVRLGDQWLTAQPLDENILSVPIMVNGQNTTRQGIARDTHLIVEITFTDKAVIWRSVVAPYNSVILEPVFGLNEPKTND